MWYRVLFLWVSFAQPLGALSWAEQTLQHMSIREKIGQLFVVSVAASFERVEEVLATQQSIKSYDYMHPSYVKTLIKEYGVGGVLFLHRSTPVQQIALMHQYNNITRYPLLMCQDCEWGLSMRLQDTVRFPRNLTLGAVQNNELLYQLGKEIGRQCRVLGIQVNFAPVADINTNSENVVIADRSFGQDKELVAQKALHIMWGMQDAGILACAKHFPGHGDTAVDSHCALPVIAHDKQRLQAIELYPFKQLIAAGVPAIMNAHLHVPSYDARAQIASSVSYTIVTDLLQNELGFKGLVITDALDMDALAHHTEPGIIELEAFLAGNDILLGSPSVPEAIKKIEQVVEQGCITLQELDRRVLKILQLKERFMRQDCLFPDSTTIMDLLHTQDAYALKKILYQEAITLVRANGVIPIEASESVAVLQVGGALHHAFTTTYFAHRAGESWHISNQPTDCECSHIAQQFEPYDTIIVSLFDMNKYRNKQYGISENTLALLHALQQKSKKLIVVLFGTPYAVPYFSCADEIVVAYEDDPDAQRAAAQVLLGIVTAKGRLPVIP
jgi:beta-N-acetylhexosaminidase